MTDWNITGINLGKVKRLSREDESAYAIRRDELTRNISELGARLEGSNGQREGIQKLIEDAQGELDELVDDFARSNMLLVITVTKRAIEKYNFLDRAEITSEMQFVLYKCALRFDHRRGFKFSTPAMKSMYRALKGLVDRTTRRHVLQGASIYNEYGEGNSASKILEDEESIGVSQGLEHAELLEQISAGIALLNGREREVLNMRYGIGNGKIMTLEAVGNVIHVSKERVRQIQNRALRKMRDAMPQLEDYLVN